MTSCGQWSTHITSKMNSSQQKIMNEVQNPYKIDFETSLNSIKLNNGQLKF